MSECVESIVMVTLEYMVMSYVYIKQNDNYATWSREFKDLLRQHITK